jgi:hypothetical protein
VTAEPPAATEAVRYYRDDPQYSRFFKMLKYDRVRCCASGSRILTVARRIGANVHQLKMQVTAAGLDASCIE